jgi:HCOMODA/2-hydroxy-3-carboxy-muconic semialdehyde decarboxylase
MSGFLGASAPIFELRDCGVMRRYGSVAVGNSVKQVVYRAIYAEVNAPLQADAMRLGKVTFLNDDEATNAATASDA